jgi:GDP-L-fucose synthase
MKEGALLTGPFEPTNEGYALAKVLGIRLAQYYWSQFGVVSICPMACNVYGEGDYFEEDRAHVVSALVKKFVDARDQLAPTVSVWGTGQARREFIYVDDLADALIFLMRKYADPEIMNVGPGTDVSIRELAMMIATATRYRGDTVWDTSRPDGMPRKCLDVGRIMSLGFRPTVSLQEGLQRTIAWYERAKGASA